jgi:hypothetical protein
MMLILVLSDFAGSWVAARKDLDIRYKLYDSQLLPPYSRPGLGHNLLLDEPWLHCIFSCCFEEDWLEQG